MKKSLLYLLLIVVFLFASCTPQATEAPAAEEPAATEPAAEEPAATEEPAAEEEHAPVTLEFWQHDSGGKISGMAAVIEAFQAQYPWITVNQTALPYEEYQTKIAASVPAGTGPDVAMAYFGWVPLWSKSGFIVPLPESVQTEIADNFVPFADSVKLDGQYYAVLTSVRNFALFYNPVLLAEAGYDAPPATWDEFVEVAKACTKTDANGNITQAGYYLDFAGDGWNWWRALIESYGGQAFSADGTQTLFNQGEGAQAAWQYMLDFTLVHKTSTPGFFEGELESFAAGLNCMTPQLTFGVGFMRDNAAPGVEWATAPMPAGPEGSFTTGSSWPLILTSKAAADPALLEASTLFLEFMASAEGQTLYCDVTGELPSRTDMLTLEKYTSDPILMPFIEQLDSTTAPFWADELGERQCAIDMYDAVIVNGEDPITALDAGAACDQAIRDAFFAE